MYIQIRSLNNEVCILFSTSDSPSRKMYNFSRLSCPQMCKLLSKLGHRKICTLRGICNPYKLITIIWNVLQCCVRVTLNILWCGISTGSYRPIHDVKIYGIIRTQLRNLGVVRNTYTVLIGNIKRKQQIRGRKLECEDYNKMGLQKPGEKIK